MKLVAFISKDHGAPVYIARDTQGATTCCTTLDPANDYHPRNWSHGAIAARPIEFESVGQIQQLANATGVNLQWRDVTENGHAGRRYGKVFPLVEVQEGPAWDLLFDPKGGELIDQYSTTWTTGHTAVQREQEFDLQEVLQALQPYIANMAPEEEERFLEQLYHISSYSVFSGWDLHASEFFLYWNEKHPMLGMLEDALTPMSMHCRVFNMLTDEEVNNLLEASIA